jgi:ABC-2 type transport system permease protein
VRNLLIIYRKEMRSYFVSPVAYLLLTMFAVVCGLFFSSAVISFVNAAMQMQMSGQSFPMNLNEDVVRPLLSTFAVISLFFVPMISMRLFAEEKRTGTIELLATSPIRDIEVILGKWLAAVTLYALMLLVTVLDFCFLFIYGNPDWKPMALGYLGLLLLGGALLAIGTLISTTTKNQIVAGGATFGVCLVLWIIGWAGEYDSSLWSQVCQYLSVTVHLDSFSKGLFDVKDAVFYVSLIFLGLFLTARSMESLRWRS